MRILAILLIVLCNSPLRGEDGNTVTMSLEDVILHARKNSVDAELAVNQLKTSYWSYRSYVAELLPEMTLRSTLPAYKRQYSPYMNNEGSYEFVRNDYLQMNGELSIAQNIWLTGGKMSLTSSLDYYRQLGSGAFNRFMSIPFAVTFSQPVFGFNSIKWDRKVEPVRYAEAQSSFLSATENVATSAIQYYFSLLMAKENVAIARQNLENSEMLYVVAKEKREMGRISHNDLLQMELNLLNARSDLTDRESDYKSNMFKLRSFLDLDDNTEIVPEIPVAGPEVAISYSEAEEKALANNSFAHEMLRRQLEADYEVAKAKGSQREINLFAQLGYTGTGRTLSDGYGNLGNNQIVEIGFEIPILDWGRRKGMVKVAESRRKLIESQVRQESMNFRQNLFILVERYGNQLGQLQISRRADEIASKRYSTNVETFLIGKISTLDLNDSRVKKDEARREYVNELYLYWLYYYQLRSLTLWDWQNNCSISADFEKIVHSR